MSFYQEAIIKATKCAPEDGPEIEEIMRNDIFHSTLDWQTKTQFNKGAREAYVVLKECRKLRSRI